MGIERLSDTEIEQIRMALEREVIANHAQQEPEDITVDELLAGRTNDTEQGQAS